MQEISHKNQIDKIKKGGNLDSNSSGSCGEMGLCGMNAPSLNDNDMIKMQNDKILVGNSTNNMLSSKDFLVGMNS